MDRKAQNSKLSESLKLSLLAGLSAICLTAQLGAAANAQSLTGLGVTTVGQTSPGLARVYTSQTVGTLPNGMIAITYPTQIMTDGRVQILTPEYRVLTLPAGSYAVQGTAVYALPSTLRGIGYDGPGLDAGGSEYTPEGRKVLGYIPPAGTSFGFGRPDPTYGTVGLSLTEYECNGTTTTSLASLSGDVAFDTNQATIKAAAQGELNSLASQMIARSGARFTVTGHTDSRGSDRYNQSLSERRAQAVVDYLAGRGVPRDSMSAVGAGEARPIASNDNAAGQARNRRVEVTSTGGATQSVRTCTRATTATPVGATTFASQQQTPAFVQPQPVAPVVPAVHLGPATPQLGANQAFMAGSQGFADPGFGGGQGFVSTDQFVANQGFAPAPTSVDPMLVADPLPEEEDGGMFSIFSDIPPVVYGVAAGLAALIAYGVVITSNGDDGGDAGGN